MVKSQLIEELAARCGITASQSEEYLNFLIGITYEKVSEGEILNISGFGKFYTKEMKATVRRNPRTHKLIKLPAWTKVKFISGLAFKRAVAINK